MAGQPQEPTWQPAGQDQARAAWPPPPPAYTPSAGSAQDTYGYPQQPGYGQQPGYAQESSYGQEAYGNGQGAPQWQATPVAPTTRQKVQKAPGERGFLGSLFDFSFTSMVTPKIIKILYVLFTIWTAIWALIFLRIGFKYGGAAGGFFTLIIVDPIMVLLTLGVYRVILEAFMVIFRIYEETKKIAERSESQG